MTPKKNGPKNGQHKARDDECFGDELEEIPDTDFDFEGNLALFDKAAVFEEIDTHERRGGGGGARSRGTPSERPPNYRHDENILESEPIVYRRIVVPHPGGKEYCTGKRTETCTSLLPAINALGLIQVSNMQRTVYSLYASVLKPTGSFRQLHMAV